ncbi:MAG: hypothetical protein FOGNACKC_00803 [Anaerolineae bacterium]|nr:hypothetical protein [Anaerolineae bacterium]
MSDRNVPEIEEKDDDAPVFPDGYFFDQGEAVEMYQLLCEAEAELAGIMPEFEPGGDREHSGWVTLRSLRDFLNDLDGRTDRDSDGLFDDSETEETDDEE